MKQAYWIWEIKLLNKSTGDKKTVEVTLPFMVREPSYVLYRAYLEEDIIPQNYEVVDMPKKLKVISC